MSRKDDEVTGLVLLVFFVCVLYVGSALADALGKILEWFEDQYICFLIAFVLLFITFLCLIVSAIQTQNQHRCS